MLCANAPGKDSCQVDASDNVLGNVDWLVHSILFRVTAEDPWCRPDPKQRTTTTRLVHVISSDPQVVTELTHRSDYEDL